MRDDIKSLSIPAPEKRYARMTGRLGTSSPGKFNLYARVVADLVNGGKTQGFKSKDASAKTGARESIEKLIR